MVEQYGNLETRFVHAGSEPDGQTGAVVPPISLATTFAQPSPGQLVGGYEYQRSNNPTRAAMERSIAAAEGAAYGVCFSSGSAALAAVIHATCESGDTIVCINDVYGGSQRYLRKQVVPIYGMKVDFVDFKDVDAVKVACKGAKLVWLETPTNPNLEVTDIAVIAEISKSAGAVLAVDNTFLGPYLQRPLSFGADIVTHSCTKSLGGHSDVVMGAAVCNDSNIHDKLRFHQNSLGAVPSPFDCYMCQRGIKTLHIRMQRSVENAQAISKFLEAHSGVDRVSWPGLPSHPQYEIAQKQQDGGGMVITFWLKCPTEESKIKRCRAFLSALKLFVCAESLGAVESLAEAPAIMTHASVPAEDRKKLCIDDSMVRLSVGIENQQDLIDDISQALSSLD